MPRSSNQEPLAGPRLATGTCVVVLTAYFGVQAAGIVGQWRTGADVVPLWAHMSGAVFAALALGKLLGFSLLCDLLQRIEAIFKAMRR